MKKILKYSIKEFPINIIFGESICKITKACLKLFNGFIGCFSQFQNFFVECFIVEVIESAFLIHFRFYFGQKTHAVLFDDFEQSIRVVSILFYELFLVEVSFGVPSFFFQL